MKIVQVVNNAGQTNGQAVVWDSITNEARTLVWAWPGSSNRLRILDRLRQSGDVIGIRYQQRESDGKNYLDRQFASEAGVVPGAIDLSNPAANTIPYDSGGVICPGGDKIACIVSSLSVYSVYDFSAEMTCTVGALGSFPIGVGGVSGITYADGSLRLVTINEGSGMMYLSSALDGSSLNTASSLALTIPENTDATVREAVAAGAVQLQRLFASAAGTPTSGTGWQMYNYGSASYSTQVMEQQSLISFSAGSDSTVQFVEFNQQTSQDVAMTISVNGSGAFTVDEETPVSGVNIELPNQWYLVGGGYTPPTVENFWHNFVRAFEDLSAA
jgi:hypothetical protein